MTMAVHQPELPSAKHASECVVEDWLAFLGHRWTAMILWHLGQKSLRHSELAALLIAVSPKVLTERLADLQDRELIERWSSETFPRAVHYRLTRRGLKLVQVLDALELWASNP